MGSNPTSTAQIRAFSPVQQPLEHVAVRSPPQGKTRWPAWPSRASDAGTGGKSPSRTSPCSLRRRRCRPHRGQPCPSPGEAAVTAQPLAPAIPSSGVPASLHAPGRLRPGGCRWPPRFPCRQRPMMSCTGSPASTPRAGSASGSSSPRWAGPAATGGRSPPTRRWCLRCDPADAAARIAGHWRHAEAAHGVL